LNKKDGIAMRILGEKSLSAGVKFFLDIIFAGGILIVLGLPFILKWYLGWLEGYTSVKYAFFLPFLYLAGILALVLVNELRKVFKTLNRMDPFRMDNVRSFKRISVCCFAIAFLYAVKIFFFNSFLTIILFMVFVIGGFFLLILAEVFRQAVIVKEENDLTI
jgi:hypothetical protein